MSLTQKTNYDSDIILDVSDLRKSFNDSEVLKGINFKAQAGQLISIIGRSGCGKTTFLRCLNCLEMFDSGTIRIAGVTLSKRHQQNAKEPTKKLKQLNKKILAPFSSSNDDNMDEDLKLKAFTIRSRVGMLFQGLNLFPHLTVLENITKAPKIVKNETDEQSTLRAIGLLEKVGLEEYMDRLPSQLSGGQAQRVAIARALAMNPQVMLYDEPTSALDPELVEEVITVMKNLHHEGMTQIVVTHAMNFARYASDLVVYMEEGKMIEIAPPEQLFTDPQDERTRQYLKIFLD